jgi:hypothetical protein
MSVSELADALRDISIYTYHEDMSPEISFLRQARNLGNRERERPMYFTYSTMETAVDSVLAKDPLHKCCNFKGKFDKDIQKVMDNIPSAVLDEHLRLMEEQSKKWR